MARAFLFPGQGSQEVGMARDLFSESASFRALIELGSDLTHEDLEALCLRGPDKRLRQSFFLQPILVAVSLGYLERLVDETGVADVVMGHSLGEITALAAAGVVSDREAVAIAAQRGKLMDESAALCRGGMLAVLSVPRRGVDELLSELARPDLITLANDNAPEQIVVSGTIELLETFASLVAERRLGRCKMLPVAGPWHSPLMAPAQREFEQWIAGVPFAVPRMPLVMNAHACIASDPDMIRAMISGQLTAPVLWRDCMERLKQMGVDVLLEVGPGRVLSGLARVNGFGAGTRVCNINNLRGLAHYREEPCQPGKE